MDESYKPDGGRKANIIVVAAFLISLLQVSGLLTVGLNRVSQF